MSIHPPGKSEFDQIRRGEAEYARQLRKVARTVGHLAGGVSPVDEDVDVSHLTQALTKYADLITPWARAVAWRMIESTAKRERRAWNEHSREMSRGLRRELLSAPTGEAQRKLMAEQVKLIRSIPLDAAQRVHELVHEAKLSGMRADTLVGKIQELGKVTRSRAELIATTEVSRMSSTLIQARSEWVGSKEYIWRTCRDGVVRPSHRAMEGVTVKWDKPPTLDNLTGHAGCLPRCRCYPEPILPGE